MGPTLRIAHTAAAYSAVSGGYSLFPWLFIKPVISAHPIGQRPRGPIHPNATQRHFTPEKLQLTLSGQACFAELRWRQQGGFWWARKSALFSGKEWVFKKGKITRILLPVLNLSPDTGDLGKDFTFTFCHILWVTLRNGFWKHAWGNIEIDKWLGICIYEYWATSESLFQPYLGGKLFSILEYYNTYLIDSN